MKRLPVLMMVMGVIALAGCSLGSGVVVPDDSEGGMALAKVSIGSVEMTAELNMSGGRQSASGLSYIYSPGTEGVLYVMPRKEISYFNALGLDKGGDFIWIADTGDKVLDPGQPVATESANTQMFRVVDIDREVKPETETDPQKQKLYDSSVPVNYMLEVSRDWVKDHGVRIGDPVEIKIVQ